MDVLIFAGAILIAYEMNTVGLSLSQVLIGEAIFADIWSLQVMYLLLAGLLFVVGSITIYKYFSVSIQFPS